jgi:hypothetical protein
MTTLAVTSVSSDFCRASSVRRASGFVLTGYLSGLLTPQTPE